jgi:hypothetical protein
VTTADAERFADLMARHPFQVATTMPKAPHEYTLGRRWDSDADFEWAVQFIRANGYEARFGGRRYTYFDLNGHSYWTIGAPIPETILINRAPTAAPSGLDIECRQGLA